MRNARAERDLLLLTEDLVLKTAAGVPQKTHRAVLRYVRAALGTVALSAVVIFVCVDALSFKRQLDLELKNEAEVVMRSLEDSLREGDWEHIQTQLDLQSRPPITAAALRLSNHTIVARHGEANFDLIGADTFAAHVHRGEFELVAIGDQGAFTRHLNLLLAGSIAYLLLALALGTLVADRISRILSRSVLHLDEAEEQPSAAPLKVPTPLYVPALAALNAPPVFDAHPANQIDKEPSSPNVESILGPDLPTFRTQDFLAPDNRSDLDLAPSIDDQSAPFPPTVGRIARSASSGAHDIMKIQLSHSASEREDSGPPGLLGPAPTPDSPGVEPSVCNVRRLVRGVVGKLNANAERNGNLLTLEVADAVAQDVFIVGAHLEQVLDQLATHVNASTKDGLVGVDVTDGGPGRLGFTIHGTRNTGREAKHEMRLETSRDSDATELSAPIIQGLIGLLNGELINRSTSDMARYYVSIPAPSAKSGRSASSALPPDAPTLLLCEDDDANALIASAMLRKLGYCVERACNGQEAFKRMEKKKFDVVLMDCQMPEVDGFEATRMILKEYDDQPPIYAITANVDPLDLEMCRASGMSGCIAKPFTMEKMATLLDYAIHGEKTPSPIETGVLVFKN